MLSAFKFHVSFAWPVLVPNMKEVICREGLALCSLSHPKGESALKAVSKVQSLV